MQKKVTEIYIYKRRKVILKPFKLLIRPIHATKTWSQWIVTFIFWDLRNGLNDPDKNILIGLRIETYTKEEHKQKRKEILVLLLILKGYYWCDWKRRATWGDMWKESTITIKNESKVKGNVEWTTRQRERSSSRDKDARLAPAMRIAKHNILSTHLYPSRYALKDTIALLWCYTYPLDSQ